MRIRKTLCAGLAMVMMILSVSCASAEKVGNRQELAEAILACAENGESGFSFSCSQGVYDDWADDDFRSGLLCFAGIVGYEGNRIKKGGSRQIDTTRLDYLAGTKIWAYYRTGRSEQLSEREWDTLGVALDIASGAEGSALEKERYIHDELCRRIRYGSDGTENNDDDCAVGALLNGVANCDGYSDAFFLTGRLAGLEVRYISGEGLSGPEYGPHMWNLIRIRRQWVMVDLTWDDNGSAEQGDGEDCTWLWYNRGTETMALDHRWPEWTTEWVTLCTRDWPELLPEDFAYGVFDTKEEARVYVNEQAASLPREIVVRLPAETVRDMTEKDQQGLQEWLLSTRLVMPVYCSFNRENGLIFIHAPQY